jgi:small subunit ribosomal protein S8
MTTKPLSEILTCIRNAVKVKRIGVKIKKSRITKKLAEIMLQEGLIEGIQDPFTPHTTKKQIPSLFLQLKYSGIQRTSIITNLQQISRPSSRVYTSHKKIPKIFGGFGLIILSTSRGLITNHRAKIYKTGGELICSIWSVFCIKMKVNFFRQKFPLK